MKLFLMLIVATVGLSSTYVSYAKSAQAEKIELGRFLYFDKRLSVDNTVSCNTCHNILNRGTGTDNLPLSKGIKNLLGGRNAPTVWNSKFWSVQFWDGRAKDLADQAKGPIINPVEMGIPNHDVVIDKIAKVKNYQKRFKTAFPGQKNPVTIDNLALAIAAFEETLVTKNSPFEKFMAGNKSALSPAASRGYQTFQQVGCTTCHSGKHFNGPELPVGTGFFMKFPTFPDKMYETKYEFSKDTGKHDATKNEADKHMWRVPSLRNVAITAPYFHNGKVKDLQTAIRVMAKLQLNKELTSEQVNDIEAFLVSLTGERPLIKEPKTL